MTNTLAKRFHVYVVDLPGCGRSDKNAHEYTNYLYVSFVTSFLRDVVGKPAVIVASGMAAAVAVTAAHADPSAVSGIILINPPSTEMLAQVPDQKSTLLRRLVATPIIGECLYHILTSRRELEYLYQEKIFYNPFRLDEKTVTVLQKVCYRFLYLGIAEYRSNKLAAAFRLVTCAETARYHDYLRVSYHLCHFVDAFFKPAVFKVADNKSFCICACALKCAESIVFAVCAGKYGHKHSRSRKA